MSNDPSAPMPANSGPPRQMVYPPWPPPPPRGAGILGCLFGVSMLFNIVAVVVIFFSCLGAMSPIASVTGEDSVTGVIEKYNSGSRAATDKIAIVHLDGVLMEGMLDFVHKSIDKAAADKNVKAVVFRVNSPGGSMTASDELYRRLVRLRDGDKAKNTAAKPIVVSMASVAASGGYYVAVTGKPLFAERTTMTGSIGVYASFPNVSGLSKDWKISMNLIKQGEIKDSGSPFKEMTPKERQVWQDLVDTAYNQFLAVVETGRPNLKGKMLEPITMTPVQAGPPGKEKAADYQRYRADGGVFTADKALQLGLIDQIGVLEDAIQEAKKQANLGDDYKAIDYEKPKTLWTLINAEGRASNLLDPARLKEGLAPRVWYLTPGYELGGLLSAAEAK